MSRFARPALVDALCAGAAGPPLLLTGPHGAGKSTLLRVLAEALSSRGHVVVALDLMGAASSPERFVAAALAALPAERFGGRLAEAVEIRRLAAAGRAQAAAAVRALFSLWTSLDVAGGRPVVLLFDEVTEIKSLAYFAGLREVAEPFAEALSARPRGTLLATSYPTLARRLTPFEQFALPPLDAAELAPFAAGASPELLLRASFGWPRYARILIDALREAPGVAEAWTREMAPGGRLDEACRASYETLLLRSRGYGIAKALLGLIAQEEGQNLTALYRKIGRSPGATRDYLGWLLGVDAVRMVGKRYYYVDGQLALWVRLHARGRAPTPAEIESAARELLAGAEVRQGADADPPRSPPRRESLMEID